MIISHQHKFIFIKTRKTASSSIEDFLARHIDINGKGKNDIITPMKSSPESNFAQNWQGSVPLWRRIGRLGEMRFWQETIQADDGKSQGRQILSGNYFNHMRARDIKVCISAKQWQEYYKFCAERNPWDKVLSMYAWQYRNKDPLLPATCSPKLFDEFLKDRLQQSPSLSDYSFYTDRRDKLLVNHVIKYESLDNEISKLFERLGMEVRHKLPHLKLGAKAKNLSYRKIYTKKQQELVARAFAQEIELFDYEY